MTHSFYCLDCDFTCSAEHRIDHCPDCGATRHGGAIDSSMEELQRRDDELRKQTQKAQNSLIGHQNPHDAHSGAFSKYR